MANFLLSAQAELLNMMKEMETLQMKNNIQTILSMKGTLDAIVAKQEAIEKRLNELQSDKKEMETLQMKNSIQAILSMKGTLEAVVAKQIAMEKRLNELQSGKKVEAASKAFGPKILLMGGLTAKNKATNEIYSFDTIKRHWQRTAICLPYKTSFQGTAVIGETIYVFGGIDSNENSVDYCYSMGSSLKWLKLANMLEKRRGINNSSVVVNDEIWVLGGCNDLRVFNTVEKYNPKSRIWIQMGPMKEPRVAAAAAVIKGKIFICGGHSGTNYLNSTEVYDPKTGVSSPFINMPSPRESLTALGKGQELYVFGGHEETNWHSTVWKINVDVKFGQWTTLPPMKAVHAGCSAASIGKEILVIGGIGANGQTTSILDSYNENKNIWEKGVSMPKSLEAPACYGLVFVAGELTKSFDSVDSMNKRKTSTFNNQTTKKAN